MFTGLIQSIGTVQLNGKSLFVEGYTPFSPLTIGDSVAVDGVCLTVATFTPNGFLSDVSEETLKKTTLGLKTNQNNFVNLEPALRLSDRLGGHLVSGHVDGLGRITSLKQLTNSWEIDVTWNDPFYGRYICDKASICLNGISLTIAESSNNGSDFSIAVIPHTWFSTSLQHLSEGNLVNLEADLMAKYAESLMKNNGLYSKNDCVQDISKDWLETNGWN